MQWTARNCTKSANAVNCENSVDAVDYENWEYAVDSENSHKVGVYRGQKELVQSQQMQWTMKTWLMWRTVQIRFIWWTVRNHTNSAYIVDSKTSHKLKVCGGQRELA